VAVSFIGGGHINVQSIWRVKLCLVYPKKGEKKINFEKLQYMPKIKKIWFQFI
jgi:hypothetical protein